MVLGCDGSWASALSCSVFAVLEGKLEKFYVPFVSLFFLTISLFVYEHTLMKQV